MSPAKTTAVKRTRKKRVPAGSVGPSPAESPVAVDDLAVAPLAERIRKEGGEVLGAYRDPFAGHPLLLASLPLKAVEPTEFQRDLSRTHADRLSKAIGDAGVFLDPIVAVLMRDGFRSPNGRHRLAAAKQLGLRSVTALVVPQEELVYRILPLNTEKAHNLRDRSLEVIRMARALAKGQPRSKETDHEAAFESPFLLTLGVAYEEKGRFSGSSYQPLLRRVDRFLGDPLPKALRQREQWAQRLMDIDERVSAHVKSLQEKGFKSPYLRTLVVARINPVRWIPVKRGEAKPPMSIAEALTRTAANVRKFDPDKVRASDLALVAAVASEE
ncbi:MAG TPA: ParB N-terminal domain-containing protein [Candidatus Limnocylindria bacterium]|nr:ParB N-terminal domain-containing protein [Candidatus Limnocylindria bacterium]